LDTDGHSALAEVFTWCPPSCLLRSACVCHAWRRAGESREAWRSLRLSFGWGADVEMRCVLRSLRRLGLRHGLTELPEARPPSPLASTPSSPGTPAMGPSRRLSPSLDEGYRFASPPPSPVQGKGVHLQSQLVLCRHSLPKSELWLLQPQNSRCHDSARRALSNVLAARLELLAGKTVLELNAGAGLVGLGLAPYCKTMTITAPDDLSCRLLHLNASLFGRRKSKSRQVATATGPNNLQVPVYVYMLPTTLGGATAFARQWQWDSGSAMRALKPSLLAPSFDLVLNAGQPIDPQGLEMCNELMAPGGLLIAVSGALEDVSPLYRALQANSFAIERDEVMHDTEEGYFRMMQLKKRR